MSTKFYYFDGRGIGEPIRMILVYGGIEFEDIRVPYDKFPPTLPAEIIAKCRWGQVPLVEFEGKSLTQSVAIARYFARKFNLVPEDLYEAALCDEYVDAVRDMSNQYYEAILMEEGAEKKEKMEEVVKKSKTRFLNVFETIVKSNDGKHLVGNSITWADIYLTYALPHFQAMTGVDLIKDYTSLKNLVDEVTSSPNIKAWLMKRPQTKY